MAEKSDFVNQNYQKPQQMLGLVITTGNHPSEAP